MRRPLKSIFVSIFIVITLVGMSLSAIPHNQNKEIQLRNGLPKTQIKEER